MKETVRNYIKGNLEHFTDYLNIYIEDSAVHKIAPLEQPRLLLNRPMRVFQSVSIDICEFLCVLTLMKRSSFMPRYVISPLLTLFVQSGCFSHQKV